MGLGGAILRDIIAFKRSGLLEGYRRIVEIGAQQIEDKMIGSPALDEIVTLFGAAKPDLVPIGSPTVGPNSPPGRLLWSALGFQSQSIDIEGGDICLDLNAGVIPEPLRGAFDLAINAGTTEHIANQENAFAVIHDLTRVGGMMYHRVPASGDIDHGFFGYQPKFFHRLASANDYDMVHFAIKVDGDFVPPAYLRGKFLPDKMLRTHLVVALVRKAAGEFVTPTDA
jgi:hypothetical protein